MEQVTLHDDLDDAIHMAVCQAINLDVDDIEEREREVKQMIVEALLAAIKRAEGEGDVCNQLKRELGMEDDGTTNN